MPSSHRKTRSIPTALCAAIVLALSACASAPSPTADFPAGARAPSAAEITTLLRGKSFNQLSRAGNIRVDYASTGDGVVVFFASRSDTGTWSAENGRACYVFKTVSSACNDIRVVGNDIFARRSNGEVVRMMPR